MKGAAAICIYLFISSAAMCQPGNAGRQEKDYARHPFWISMMDDEHVNYFEAVKAYEIYWRFHSKPVEEDQILNTKGLSPSSKHEHKTWLDYIFAGRDRRNNS